MPSLVATTSAFTCTHNVRALALGSQQLNLLKTSKLSLAVSQALLPGAQFTQGNSWLQQWYMYCEVNSRGEQTPSSFPQHERGRGGVAAGHWRTEVQYRRLVSTSAGGGETPPQRYPCLKLIL